MNFLSELLNFMRLKISFTGAVIALTGFLLFNPLGSDALLVFLAAFFGVSFAYSYNLITDKEEDIANGKKLNALVENGGAIKISATLALVGAFFAWELGLMPLGIYVIYFFTGLTYSRWRIKKRFPWKYIYVSLGYSIIFIFGAAQHSLNLSIFKYYFLVSAVIFLMGLLADMRDHTGDLAAEIRTLPVVVGYDKSKLIALYSFGIIGLAITVSWSVPLYPIVLFGICGSIILSFADRPSLCHHYFRVGFLIVPFLKLVSLLS